MQASTHEHDGRVGWAHTNEVAKCDGHRGETSRDYNNHAFMSPSQRFCVIG